MDFTDTQTSTNTLLERVQAAAAAGTLGPALDKVADTTANPAAPVTTTSTEGAVSREPAQPLELAAPAPQPAAPTPAPDAKGAADATAPPAEPTLNLFLVSRATDTDPKALQPLTWPDLIGELVAHERRADKDGAGVIPAIFRDGGRRVDADVIAFPAVLFLDLDHQPPEALPALKAKLEGREAFVYSTFSHRPEDVCLRVVVRLSRGLSLAEFPRVRRAAEASLGIEADPKTRNPSRFYYLPSAAAGAEVVSLWFDGVPLDVDALLAAPQAPSAPPRALPVVGTTMPVNVPSVPVPALAAAASFDLGSRREVLKSCERALRQSHDPDQARQNRDRESAEILRRILKGEPLAEPGSRDDTANRAASLLVFHLPPTPADALLELLRPSLGAMENPDGTDWQAEAMDMIRRAQGDRAEKDARDAEFRQRFFGAHPPGRPAGLPEAEAEADPDSIADPLSEPLPVPEELQFTNIGDTAVLCLVHRDSFHRVQGLGTVALNPDTLTWERDPEDVRALFLSEDVASYWLLKAQEAEQEATRLESEGKDGLPARELAKFMTTYAKKCASMNSRRAAVEGWKAQPGVALPARAFDADPYALNCPNGVVDLRTGALRPRTAADLFLSSTATPYRPGAGAPRWDRFLAEVQPDPEVRAFLQVLAGYMATGVIRTHKLPIFAGGGRNGKGVWAEVIQKVLGSYSGSISVGVLAPSGKWDATEDARHKANAEIHGKRFVVTSEPAEGCHLDVAYMKTLTGGDKLIGKFLYEDQFEFWPSHKIAMLANHLPRVSDDLLATWDRVLIVPWPVSFPDGDPRQNTKLPAQLVDEEAEGVLAWIVAGAVAWHQAGEKLSPPRACQDATNTLRRNEDQVGRFLEDRCTLHPDHKTLIDTLHSAYKQWAAAGGSDVVLSPRAFGARLSAKGLEAEKGAHGARMRVGVALKGGGIFGARVAAQ